MSLLGISYYENKLLPIANNRVIRSDVVALSLRHVGNALLGHHTFQRTRQYSGNNTDDSICVLLFEAFIKS